MNEVLVHIILVNYNGINDTEECIESIQNSDYRNIVIDVVDNNSEPSEVERLKQYVKSISPINLIQNKANVGFAAANNIGIRFAQKAEADIIVLLNNDTIVKQDTISQIVKAICRDVDKNVYTGKILYHTHKDIVWYAGGKYDLYKGTVHHIGCNCKDSDEYNVEQFVDFASGCYIAFRASVVSCIGYISEDYFLYSEDVDYSLQIRKAGYGIKYIPSSTVYHKLSVTVKKQKGLSNYYMQRNRMIVIRKYHKGLNKVSAYIYSLVVFIKSLVTKKTSLSSLIDSIYDFIKHNYGKNTIFD